ncbi:MAG: L-aspartate oxidase [Kiritimatiellae bacterium]|nr:L-aspartate oxidase [Kiritimatiellia bacterium]
MKLIDADYVVVGSGLAGLSAALKLAERGRVLVLTKKAANATNTSYAQGGIASVTAPDDSFEQHVADTLDAGAGLCDADVATKIIEHAPVCIEALEAMGLRFSRSEDGAGGRYDLGREGGHSARRVLHAGDFTGRHIQDTLLDSVAKTPSIRVLQNHMVIDLITTGWIGVDGENRCIGAYVMNSESCEIMAVRAPHVILATGGAGKVYLYTSNPDVATADGVAIGWRAGVPVKNMEFIQFHPSCLFHPEAKSFLVSEAVRGEGAKLVDVEGVPFMNAYDERGALAPRDIVARAIDSEMKSRGVPSVYLDIRHQPEAFLKDRFPNIHSTCGRFGIDMAKDLIPVVPAAHYCCGGLEADLNGHTAVPGLYAIGEVACTGFHGANRLASNSLLEAIVCAHELAASLAEIPVDFDGAKYTIPDWESGDAVHSDEAIVVEHNWNEVRTCMWDYVGIVRTDKRLERALRRIQNLRGEIRDYYLDYLITPDVLELRNIADVADLIVRSARSRHESRGLHYTLDYPEAADNPVDTVIRDVAGQTHPSHESIRAGR